MIVSRCLLLMSFLMLISNVYAQDVHFFKDGTRWVYYTEESYEPGQIWQRSSLEENLILGDTVLHGTVYKKLYRRFVHFHSAMPPLSHQSAVDTSYESRGPEYIRLSESGNKVFHKSHPDSSEVLIFDFDLQAGDTIPLRSQVTRYNEVKKVDTIQVFGQSRKIFILDTLTSPVRNAIVEGIGGLNGLTENNPEFPVVSGGIFMTELICFQYNGQQYFPPNSIHNSYPCPLPDEFVSKTFDQLHTGFGVAPNPNSGIFTVTVPERFLGSEFILFDPIGAVLQKTTLKTLETTVSVNSSGLHFYSILSPKHQTSSGRLLIYR